MDEQRVRSVLRTLIINFKNYSEVSGEGSIRLARAAEEASRTTGNEVIVAPPSPMLAMVRSEVDLPVFSQTADADEGEKTTGALTPEALRGAGVSGTLLNHSESRKKASELSSLVPRLQSLGLRVCICARTAREAAALSTLSPDYLAIEPPELIGSGVAVSRANPRLVSNTVSSARKAGYAGDILCGAGILSGRDVAKAIELGTSGVLVSSGVVKSSRWKSKIQELADSLK